MMELRKQDVEDELEMLKKNDIKYLVFGYGNECSGDTSYLIFPLYGWNSKTKNVYFDKEFLPAFANIIRQTPWAAAYYFFDQESPLYKASDLDSLWGMNAMNVLTQSVIRIGHHRYTHDGEIAPNHYERRGEIETLRKTIVELNEDYKTIVQADNTDWQDSDRHLQLYELSMSRNLLILRALAMNPTVPDYILAQLAEENDLLKALVSQNPNSPTWLVDVVHRRL